MLRGVPLQHFNQCSRRTRRRHGGERGRLDLASDAGARRTGLFQRRNQILHRFCFTDCLHRQPHPKRALDSQNQFGATEAVDAEVAFDAAIRSNIDEAGALRMQFAHKSAHDCDKIAFARLPLGRWRRLRILVRP